ncbi:MAG: hypothetical protein ABGY75_08795 [Gemmataceae bacterium]
MVLSQEAVDALNHMIVLLYFLGGLLVLNLFKLESRHWTLQDWTVQGFQELGKRVHYLERELARVLAHNNLQPLPHNEDGGPQAAGDGVEG